METIQITGYTLESRLFESFLADPDRSSDSCQHDGIYSQYESYEDDGNIASLYPGSYETAGCLWPNNEVMATHLQEMSIYGEESGNTSIKTTNFYLIFI
ncbi:hypothetical protein IMY05_012G0093600 [Salix suchowensis]|nr:hypothetical protein IMY05_012G0093600 [Salix suchowensis]